MQTDKGGTAAAASATVHYLETAECYNRWAAIYDTDNNFLQAMDTLEMASLMPALLARLEATAPAPPPPPTPPAPWKLVDIGCGTGRNTMALLHVPGAHVYAIDFSPGMLEVCRRRLAEEEEKMAAQRQQQQDGQAAAMTTAGARAPGAAAAQVHTLVHDLADAAPASLRGADAAVATLVVEHVPLALFFERAAEILRPGGLLLLTNMHDEMGSVTQAGFVDPATGVKMRPTSYAHSVPELVAEAARWGFEVDGDGFQERAVDESNLDRLGPRAKKYKGVKCWYGGILRRRTDSEDSAVTAAAGPGATAEDAA